MNDGVSIRVVWARLETSVANVGLANEIELLSKVVASTVGGVRHEDGKGYVREAVLGDIGYIP